MKEEDFSELRRYIFRDVVAKNDENNELKRKKLIDLNHAYKSGDVEELAKASSLPIEQKLRTITDVLTNTQKRYVGELFYEINWVIDEEPADVRFKNFDKWIFTPTGYGESKNHEKYIRGYLHFYKWYKKRGNPYRKIKIDIYDGSFISNIERYWQGGMDISRIPENLLCIKLAKLSISRLNLKKKIKGYNALAVFCIAKEIRDNTIIYYDGWDSRTRKENILRGLCQK